MKKLCLILGHHNAQKLRHWMENFLQNQTDTGAQGFDQKFYRLWLYYLDYCFAEFEEKYNRRQALYRGAWS